MDYGQIFEDIARECDDLRAYVIIGILQSIRDDRLINDTVLDDMLNLIYNQKKCCPKNYTQDSTKIYTINNESLQFGKN